MGKLVSSSDENFEEYLSTTEGPREMEFVALSNELALLSSELALLSKKDKGKFFLKNRCKFSDFNIKIQ
jgi:hypothetical protein